MWQPNYDYDVDVSLNSLTQACKENEVYLNTKKSRNIREAQLIESSLNDLNGINFDIWQTMIHGNNQGKSFLTFKMITRLVVLLLENNPDVVESIRKTYKMVFLDEFQDTTVLQYELLSLCFKGTENIITAVGDDRQKIMTWAGAHPNAFSTFEDEFEANQHALYINRRSDIKIQKLLQELNEYAQGDFLGKDDDLATEVNSDAIVQVKTFCSSDEETLNIIDMIQNFLNEGKDVEDICILVKQLPDDYVDQLKSQFNNVGINFIF